FANDQISLAHLVFKLLRHMIWLRPSRRNEVCQHILPAVLEKLDSLGCSDLAEREKIAAHAFAHTLSDLAAIMHLTFESGRQDLLYDVRKKVLNIFEIADIFGISQGNPLQMNLYRNQAST
ncbi:MAG: hypothetical protein OEZ01_05130, partial [Candidatus Heimdallarchaeota archaeon]|nr:hypothetical protein [Candidatus Heimdallarchaeota archaeon]